MLTLSAHRGHMQFNTVPSKIVRQNFFFHFTPLKPPQDHPFVAQCLFPTTPVFPTDVAKAAPETSHL